MMVDLSREIATRVGFYWLRLNYLCQFLYICNYLTNVKYRFCYIAIIIIIIIVVVVVIIQMSKILIDFTPILHIYVRKPLV